MRNPWFRNSGSLLQVSRRSRRQGLQMFVVLLLAAGLSGFGSCSVSVEEICQNRLPGFEQAMGIAQDALKPWEPDAGAGRMPAANGMEMAQIDRHSWENWAMDRLRETQAYIDILETQGRLIPVKKELSKVATDLVAFHGYTAEGNVPRMTAILARIRERTHQAGEKNCSLSGR